MRVMMDVDVCKKYLSNLMVNNKNYLYIDLKKVINQEELHKLPYSMRILLENVARCSPESLNNVLQSIQTKKEDCEVAFYPNRLMLHDTTCLPALADFAGMRDAVAKMGGDPTKVNPIIPSVLTVDHSVIVEHYGEENAVEENLNIDYRRNSERYRFIKWAQKSLDNFTVVPPGTGIIHQINMESLAKVVWETKTNSGKTILHPDGMIATDSHTPMINAIGILGWGVGGLQGQAAMLGEPASITLPKTLGIRLLNELGPGITAVDLALHVTQLLRKIGVVGKFVEFCGPGLNKLPLAIRGTLSNMAPEYGATVVFFPFDTITMDYMQLTGRSEELCQKIKTYLEKQSLWRHESAAEPVFDQVIELDLATIEPSVAGPNQPHQRHKLSDAPKSFRNEVLAKQQLTQSAKAFYTAPSFDQKLTHGAISIAAITSCTNTANPNQLIQAGLLARNANKYGLKQKPWVKTSLSPGSRVVADYLANADLLKEYAALGFHLTGFGCMTCIGNSGPLHPELEKFSTQGLQTVVVLSGNRNFQSRVNPKVQIGYLMSPALVVAYSLVGTIDYDVQNQALGQDQQGNNIYLHDVMPSDKEVQELLEDILKPSLFINRNAQLWDGTHHWQTLEADSSVLFDWQPNSTYLRSPIYLQKMNKSVPESLEIKHAKVILILEDNITTDHISPASAIPLESQAGEWLVKHGESADDLNQYSTRRSNHEVMMRGAFVNPSVRNLLLEEQPPEGGWAKAINGSVMRVYDAALSYVNADIPLLLFAGLNYGSGSSRDWAAKAQATLGIKAVIARSFERIHRSNLIGMGVFPIEFIDGLSVDDLALDGSESFDVNGLDNIDIGSNIVCLVINAEGRPSKKITLNLPIESQQEIRYLKHGGLLPSIVRTMANENNT